MMLFFKKFGCLILFLFAGAMVMAQSIPFKTLSVELQSLQKQLVPDKRVAILDIGLQDTLQPKPVISGETDLPEAKAQIIQYLTDNKIQFIDSIRLLPDIALGEKIWALATLSVSNIRALPDDASELVSQALMGTPLRVLDYKNKFYRVQTPDKYIGWMDAGGLQLFTEKELGRWKGTKRFLFISMSGYACDAPRKKAEVVSDLVIGDLFEVEAKVRGYLIIRLPDGRSGYVRKSHCISFEDWSNTDPKVSSIVSVARNMMGSPYLWGGASSKANDCSGFVKVAYYAQGIILARDASQQAKYGEPVDFSKIENLQPGDLLFFGRDERHITHTGIYLGNGDFIHSSGRVLISSIDPTDPKYNPARKSQAARRVMHSLNTEGIVRVKDHPWYINKP
ncbi:MAG: C40 family peptidase [Bacteroidales bacterium]|nr:C40 family peptidase [Bacteroidales bacterium]